MMQNYGGTEVPQEARKFVPGVAGTVKLPGVPGTDQNRNKVATPETFFIIDLQVRQYFVVRIVLIVLCLALIPFGLYTDGLIAPSSPWFYITGINAVSLMVALWGLFRFYGISMGLSKGQSVDETKDQTFEHFRAFDPKWKFIGIKAIISFSFFQALMIRFIVDTTSFSFAGLDVDSTVPILFCFRI